MKTEFTTTFANEFGIVTRKFKAEISNDMENTFRNCCKKLPKFIDKKWQSIEFKFNNETILVCKHWLIETDFDFSNSHQII